MYFDYQTGQLIQPNQRYANPSQYFQYGTGETGMNRGKANGVEQGTSDAMTGVFGGMGGQASMWMGIGKGAYGGLKSTNTEVGDGFATIFAPHHTTAGIIDDAVDAKDSKTKTKKAFEAIGSLDPLANIILSVARGREKRAKEAGANYVNSVESPFLFALDKNGLQFAQAKAQAPESVQSNTGWLTALGGMVGSGIKSGISASQKTQSNPVAPSTQVALNDEKPTTSLAFQENTLGTKTDNEGNALVKGKNPNWNWWSTDENNNTTYPGDFNNGGNMIGLGAGQTNFGYKKGGSVMVEGGKGDDDIALVDTTSGKDTGVRVAKDEMIVFSKKNVEALEKAVGKNQKDIVFKLVKNQMAKHGEAIEGEKHFEGGGYENLSNDELKKLYLAETEGKDFGKQDYAKFTAIEDELKKRKVDFNEWHYLNPRYSPFTFLKQALDPTRADVFEAGVNKLKGAKDVVVDYGDPIKDPEGYKTVLRRRAKAVYANRHGMKFDANLRPVDLDAKKLSAIEEELKKGDLERMKKSSSTNPDVVWKGLGVEHIVKGDYLANSPFIANQNKSSNDEIPTITWNGEGEDPIKKGAKLTAYSSRNSQKTTTTTATGGALPVVPETKVVDPSMLDVNGVSKGLNMPSAKTINTPAEKTNNDEIYNALGYAGDAIKLGLGMQAATQKLPQWQISDNWNEYMGKLKFMSNMGLTPEQKAQYLDTADRTYQYDTANIYNLANGNAGTVLGNLGRANANRYRAGVDMAVADRSAQNANNANYGGWLARDEQYRKSIFDENRNQLAMTKQAGMQLASDALANIENRTDYNRFYGKGSQVEKLQNMQLEKQQYENDILKAQKENMSNPDYWKRSAVSSNKSIGDGTKAGVDISTFTPEQLQALKTLFAKS